MSRGEIAGRFEIRLTTAESSTEAAHALQSCDLPVYILIVENGACRVIVPYLRAKDRGRLQRLFAVCLPSGLGQTLNMERFDIAAGAPHNQAWPKLWASLIRAVVSGKTLAIFKRRV